MKNMYISEQDLNYSWTGQRANSILHTIYKIKSMEFELCVWNVQNDYYFLLDLNIEYGEKLFSIENRTLNVQTNFDRINECVFSNYDMKKYLINLDNLDNLCCGEKTNSITGKYLDRLSKPNGSFRMREKVSISQLEEFMIKYPFIKFSKKSIMIYHMVKKSTMKKGVLVDYIFNKNDINEVELSNEEEQLYKKSILDFYMKKEVFKSMPILLKNENSYIENILKEEKLSYTEMQKKIETLSKKFLNLRKKQKNRSFIEYDKKYDNLSLKNIILKILSKNYQNNHINFLDVILKIIRSSIRVSNIENDEKYKKYESYVVNEFILNKKSIILHEILIAEDSVIDSLI